ncbi:hypothetical protein MTAT_20050 [Moorella thermoacetica]|uniref:Uncharacterized protein n=1 Tax=Neomoorella thermoacetica TaxID=1525 RepID=A0AAC9MVB3_NEOTH|nr:hypothetical protein Maut_02232 [Moorella thermoacetica]TYL12763.1 hypothetical protein MTAT_20050 [Moorella thermoacetica]
MRCWRCRSDVGEVLEEVSFPGYEYRKWKCDCGVMNYDRRVYKPDKDVLAVFGSGDLVGEYVRVAVEEELNKEKFDMLAVRNIKGPEAFAYTWAKKNGIQVLVDYLYEGPGINHPEWRNRRSRVWSVLGEFGYDGPELVRINELLCLASRVLIFGKVPEVMRVVKERRKEHRLVDLPVLTVEMPMREDEFVFISS